jgi:hypothetical protein
MEFISPNNPYFQFVDPTDPFWVDRFNSPPITFSVWTGEMNGKKYWLGSWHDSSLTYLMEILD